jgi:hypothetical protein
VLHFAALDAKTTLADKKRVPQKLFTVNRKTVLICGTMRSATEKIPLDTAKQLFHFISYL